MKSSLIRRVLLLMGAMLPVAAEAEISNLPNLNQITVWIGTFESGDYWFGVTKELLGKPTVNLDFAVATGESGGGCPTALGAPSTARCIVVPQQGEFTPPATFSITKSCTGSPLTCRSAPRPRASIVDGAIDTLTFTDVLIKNHSTTDATLYITIHSGQYETAASEPGIRRYAIETSGSFPSITPNDSNRMSVQLSPCSFETQPGEGEGAPPVLFSISCGGARTIDNPEFDENEGDEQASLIFPPYKPAQTTQFSNKEEDGKQCGSGVVGDGTPCIPWIRLIVGITLAPNETIRLPGSITGAGQEAVCDLTKPETAPACNRWFSFYAGLGPKGAEIYRAHLEPTPGSGNLNVRGVLNENGEIWVSRRVAHDDEHGVGTGVSQTTVRLDSAGNGEVTAHGLCPLEGCVAGPLPVRVYCGQDNLQPAFATTLVLNNRGDGSAQLVAPMPCSDPAVLIMRPGSPLTPPPGTPDGEWVAAPVIR